MTASGRMSTFQPIPATSVQYVGARITVKKLGVIVDPTGDAVTMAFMPAGPPATLPSSGDWKTAVWHTDTTTTPHTYTADCLLGSTVTLTAGTYAVFVKIVDSPETPIIPISGLLTIL